MVLRSQGPPNHVPSMGPPLFIKTQTRKGGADRSRVAKKGCWDRVLQPVWLGVWERVWRCVFLEEGGVYGNWLWYYDLIERHPPTPLPRREDGSGSRAARDPPLPRQQFAVWVAQRGGQRSNKCTEMEVLSHGNAVTKNCIIPGLLEKNSGALDGGIYEYDTRCNQWHLWGIHEK